MSIDARMGDSLGSSGIRGCAGKAQAWTWLLFLDAKNDT